MRISLAWLLKFSKIIYTEAQIERPVESLHPKIPGLSETPLKENFLLQKTESNVHDYERIIFQGNHTKRLNYVKYSETSLKSKFCSHFNSMK